MVSVLGHWEIGYMTPIMEEKYWSLVLRDFNVNEMNMVPISGIKQKEISVKLNEYHNYDDALNNIDKKLVRVFIEPRTKHYNPNTIWLHEFEHPENCLYIFGSAHYNPTISQKDPIVVSIKTKDDKGVLWSNQCLSLVLYDRMLKENKID